ncbi:MAG TPA: aspartate/glutamate racemase family protein, partial [Roseiarcus sp.]|nr:aspartate/glutamate racemase family protein [Roseiarcus sp.]
MKPRTILVINPAANPGMTERIDATVAPFRLRHGVEIVCETLAAGPRIVASNGDVDAAAVALRARLAEETDNLAVAVIACYADPGLHACREATPAPVLGAGRCAALAALARADNFGV